MTVRHLQLQGIVLEIKRNGKSDRNFNCNKNSNLNFDRKRIRESNSASTILESKKGTQQSIFHYFTA